MAPDSIRRHSPRDGPRDREGGSYGTVWFLHSEPACVPSDRGRHRHEFEERLQAFSQAASSAPLSSASPQPQQLVGRIHFEWHRHILWERPAR
jgi:hypothetical protein